MDSLIGIFLSSFAIAFSGAIVPGPVLTVTVSETAKRGFFAGPLIVCGHGILEVILIALVVMGLSDLMHSEVFLGIVGIFGGVFLVWLSFDMLWGIGKIKGEFTEGIDTWGGPIMAGILTSVANPYWIIWWVTVGFSYIVISMKFGLLGLAVFFVGHILADLLWYSFISFLVSRGKRHLSARIYKVITGVCALLLVFFGLYFGLWGVGNLL
ncbi:MAG: LysE family transporter [Thermodesulfobacteriota bacterium]|nr:LysE family transporter [Thermodesulfobacteriota bacterium]